MVSKVYSVVLKGLTGQPIEVEVSVAGGLRAFNIVGLADKAIEEAKERVTSAIKNIKLASPVSEPQRVLINLAPADLKKEGSLYDLAIALGYLLATDQTRFNPSGVMLVGELALDGRLKPITGALAATLVAKAHGFTEIILPQANIKEASLANLLNPDAIKIIGVSDLIQAINYLEGDLMLEPAVIDPASLKQNLNNYEVDLAFIQGQQHAKRGLEIAASGGHNLFLEGPPGAGKTLLAKAIVSILPELEPAEMLELTQIYSLAGLLKPEQPFVNQRPFRAPHHTASESALIGGGSPPRPGEITLSHRGVLFLDEFPEFHRDVLESLRQPLEDGNITVLRSKHRLHYPASFTLIAAANPCPCGFHGNAERECSCTGSQVASYKRKMSGPLMDRIDLFCVAPAIKYQELTQGPNQETSREVKQRVQEARVRQRFRFQKENFLTNSQIQHQQLKQYCPLPSQADQQLQKLVDSGQLSARGYHRVLKVSRTIADLKGHENITNEDLGEALSYRRREES